MDIKSAEMTKYAANAMLATKISFMNEMANICETTGANVEQVRLGIGSDKRIGYDYIYAGCGYGGSCFPKDIQALINTSKSYGYYPRILSNVEEVNNDQKMVLVNKIIDRFGDDLSGITLSIWGLSFKPGTDDVREATSIVVISELIKKGAKIKAYDPQAMDEFKKAIGEDYLASIEFVENRYSSYKTGIGADIVSGKATLESLAEYALTLDNVKPESGRQEYLETILNSVIFGG